MASARLCEAPGCAAAAEYRAPKSRSNLKEYRWFCLDHVREYNRSWNYFAGMSEAEIEVHIRRDTTWDRPTWPAGNWTKREWDIRNRVFQDFFDADPARAGAEDARQRHMDPEETRLARAAIKALAVLDLDPPVTIVEIKARYKELVKRHHPDRHGGDKAAEEMLKRINVAYHVLKSAYAL